MSIVRLRSLLISSSLSLKAEGLSEIEWINMVKQSADKFVFQKELAQQLVTLSTSAFGLAAALAWNETIQATVKEFIEPKIPGAGILSRFIYAILVTILGVIITYQLSRLASRWGIEKGNSEINLKEHNPDDFHQ